MAKKARSVKVGHWRYQKACKCDATSTRGAIRFTDTYDRHGDALRKVVSFFPQPTCDACGQEWEISGRAA